MWYCKGIQTTTWTSKEVRKWKKKLREIQREITPHVVEVWEYITKGTAQIQQVKTSLCLKKQQVEYARDIETRTVTHENAHFIADV